MNIHDPIDDCNVVGRVKPRQKLIASEYFSGSGHESSQQIEFVRGELNRMPVQGDLALFRIKTKSP